MRSFGDRIAKRGEDFLLRCNRAKASVGLELYSQIVRGTPVDTGRARGNWLPSTVQPIYQTTYANVRSPEVGIREAKEEYTRATIDEDLIMQNNLPYIYRLEFDGWSRQAPGGWVRAAVGRFREIIRRAWNA